jgi:hypothetical protein
MEEGHLTVSWRRTGGGVVMAPLAVEFGVKGGWRLSLLAEEGLSSHPLA